MALNGIDIASHQAGLVPANVDADFIIIKATEGTSYVNPCFESHYAQTKAAGKLLGIYHYSDGSDADKEAAFFCSVVGARAGEAILVLDWESSKKGLPGYNPVFGSGSELSWVQRFMEHVHTATGAWPLIYMSKSVIARHDWSLIAKNCPLWVAQYASNTRTGYQSKPWTDGRGYGAWQAPAIFQYSSHGHISGWDKDIDINIAYLTRDEWMALAGGGTIKPAAEGTGSGEEAKPAAEGAGSGEAETPAAESAGSGEETKSAAEVTGSGEEVKPSAEGTGSGEAEKTAAESAGSGNAKPEEGNPGGSGDVNPQEDKFAGKSDADLAVEVMFRLHGRQDTRREELGSRYNGVQAVVESFYLDSGKGIGNYQTALTDYLKKWGCGTLVN